MSGPVRAVFMGSPAWAVPSLAALLDAQALGFQIVGVLTQPDRPAGRGRRLQPCPVKEAALERGLSVLNPATLRTDEGCADLIGLAPDLAIVCAYGQILPRTALDLPRLGCWNLHFSLLPRWRGASPVQAAILAGDATTGVSLQRMVEALDAGPLVASSAAVIIGMDESAEALGSRLAEVGASLLREALPAILTRAPSLTPQDDSRVTICRKIDKRAGLVDWSQESAIDIARKVRAFTPWPGCANYLGAMRLGLVRVEALAAGGGPPGKLGADGVVAAADGSVRLLEVKPEGKGAMPFAAFANGRPEAIGQTLRQTPA